MIVIGKSYTDEQAFVVGASIHDDCHIHLILWVVTILGISWVIDGCIGHIGVNSSNDIPISPSKLGARICGLCILFQIYSINSETNCEDIHDNCDSVTGIVLTTFSSNPDSQNIAWLCEQTRVPQPLIQQLILPWSLW